jgi:glycosyltransferase involved in cell wall biosynthesis
MNITVILCSYNRCESLAKTLASIAVSVLPESVEWDILVVDNNSSDQTREVTEEFCRKFPGRFRYLFEPQPGKSYALNSAIRAARGEIVAFTDDDVTVDANWLCNLTVSLDKNEWAGAGGRTLFADSFTPPSWMAVDGPCDLGGVLAARFDLGDKACELFKAPYGANMAFQKRMFEKHGFFRTDLGPSPNREIPRPNEDTEFGRRLLAGGERLRYESSAIVYHPVVAERVRKDYFLNWYFDYGRANVREWRTGPSFFWIPRRFFNLVKTLGMALPQTTFRWALDFRPDQRFCKKCFVYKVLGQIHEIYHQLSG